MHGVRHPPLPTALGAGAGTTGLKSPVVLLHRPCKYSLSHVQARVTPFPLPRLQHCLRLNQRPCFLLHRNSKINQASCVSCGGQHSPAVRARLSNLSPSPLASSVSSFSNYPRLSFPGFPALHNTSYNFLGPTAPAYRHILVTLILRTKLRHPPPHIHTLLQFLSTSASLSLAAAKFPGRLVSTQSLTFYSIFHLEATSEYCIILKLPLVPSFAQ